MLCCINPPKKTLIKDLEEELELDRRRVSEAEGVAKRAEEELAVAKERLLLQEDELQSRAGDQSVFLSHLSAGEVSAELSTFPLFIVTQAVLMKLQPHTVIIYTGKCITHTLFIHHEREQFHQSVIIPSQQNALNFIHCMRKFFVFSASLLSNGLLLLLYIINQSMLVLI